MVLNLNLAGDLVVSKIAEIESSDGSLTATILIGDTGATTKGATAVFLFPRGWTGNLWENTNRVFIAEYGGEVECCWGTTDELTIFSNRGQLLKNQHLGAKINLMGNH